MTLIEFFKEAAYLTLRRELLVVKGWVSKNKHLNDGCICLGNWSVTESSKKKKQKKTKNKKTKGVKYYLNNHVDKLILFVDSSSVVCKV